MPSFLDNLQASDISNDPFPHVLIRNALPAAFADRMLAEIRLMDEKRPISSSQRDAESDTIQEIEAITGKGALKEFHETHTSPEFFQRVCKIFEREIETRLPLL